MESPGAPGSQDKGVPCCVPCRSRKMDNPGQWVSAVAETRSEAGMEPAFAPKKGAFYQSCSSTQIIFCHAVKPVFSFLNILKHISKHEKYNK